MPSTSISVDWDTLAIVGVKNASSQRDGLKLNSGWMAAVEKFCGKGTPAWKTGPRRSVDVQMVVHTGITEFFDGYEEFDNTALSPSRVPIYTPAIAGMLMKIGLTEMMTYANSGDVNGALQSKIEQLQTNCFGFLSRNWVQRCVAGLGSGFSRWITMNGIDSTAGVFEYAAVGSQSNTIGGLSKSTYAGVIGWQNVVVNLNNAFGSNLTGLQRAIIKVKRHATSLAKHAWIFSDAAVENYKRIVQSGERYVDQKAMDAGLPVEKYGGIPIFQEPQMPVSTATGGSGTNTRPMSALLVDFANIHPEWMKGAKVGEMKTPDGYFGTGVWGPTDRHQMVAACPMLVAGQNIIEDMGTSALCHSGETY